MPNAADAIILCGGAGLRMKSVTGDAPKSLASIGKRPFLEILLRQLRRHGFDKAILAVGYRRDLIRSHFGDQAQGLEIRYSIESKPLGTGGALRNAVDLMDSDVALILNGDSYTDADLQLFSRDYQSSNVDLSILVVPADGRTDCGLVSVDAGGKVLGFKEKQFALGKQFVNAGIYMLSKRLLAEIAADVSVSLETELFPRWLTEGKHLRAYHHRGHCIDIGTPERYRDAQIILGNAEAVASSS
jgi:D-glycero-alpha-D-manno-heptose 1-phosphate guanylyltransferase